MKKKKRSHTLKREYPKLQLKGKNGVEIWQNSEKEHCYVKNAVCPICKNCNGQEHLIVAPPIFGYKHKKGDPVICHTFGGHPIRFSKLKVYKKRRNKKVAA